MRREKNFISFLQVAILNYVAGGGEGARERAPSMKNSEPVTKAALRSSAKKATALPMSSGLPAFLSGWYSLAMLSAFSLNKNEKKHDLSFYILCNVLCFYRILLVISSEEMHESRGGDGSGADRVCSHSVGSLLQSEDLAQ